MGLTTPLPNAGSELPHGNKPGVDNPDLPHSVKPGAPKASHLARVTRSTARPIAALSLKSGDSRHPPLKWKQ